MSQPDLSDVAADALTDYVEQLFGGVRTLLERLYNNTYQSFAQMSTRRWTRVIGCVVVYIIIRPYIEKLFKKMHDNDRKKEAAKKAKEREEAVKMRKPKVSANALRGGGADEAGKVLGEVENTDDEIEEGEEEGEDFATASGVPEFSKNMRKRQKKFMKSLEKEAGARTHDLSDEQIMELLDWSESEDEKEGKKDN